LTPWASNLLIGSFFLPISSSYPWDGIRIALTFTVRRISFFLFRKLSNFPKKNFDTVYKMQLKSHNTCHL